MGKRKAKKYTENFKRSSAKLASESDQSIAATPRNLGVNEITLYGWVKRYSDATTPAGSTETVDKFIGESHNLPNSNNRWILSGYSFFIQASFDKSS